MSLRARSSQVLDAAIVALSLATFAPALGAPRYDDDHTQLAWLRGELSTHRAPWDLYALIRPADHAAAVASGELPWWLPRDTRASTLRPMSSLLLWFDVHALGGGALAAHLHSFAWLALLALAARRLFRSAGLGDGASRAALAFVVTSTPLAVDLAWLCNRCAIVASALSLLALERALRWRRSGSPRDLAATLAAWAFALASGEYAFAFVPMALVLSTPDTAPEATSRGRRATLAFIALALAWFAVGRALGYGGAHVNGAIDPVASPTRFIALLPLRALGLIWRWLASLADAGRAWPSSLSLVALAIVGASTAYSLARSDRRAQTLAWCIASAGAGSVLAAALPHVRVLLPWVIATAGLFGALWSSLSSRRAAAVLRVAVLALVAHQAVASWRAVRHLVEHERERDNHLRESGLRLAAAQRVLLVSSDDPELLLSPARAWAPEGGATPSAWVTVGVTAAPVIVLRPSQRELVVRAVDGRAIVPPTANHDARVADVTLRAEALRDGAATQVRVTFDEPPETSGWTLAEASGTRCVAISFPPVNAGRISAPAAR